MGNKVYIFGGEDRSRRAVADLYVLDMTSLQWSKPEVEGPSPSARSAHIACAVEDRFLVVFGGGSVARCYNDVWAFDTETSSWSSLKPAGPAPSARAGWGFLNTVCPILLSASADAAIHTVAQTLGQLDFLPCQPNPDCCT